MTKADLVAKVRERINNDTVPDDLVASWLNFAAREYRALHEVEPWAEYVVREAAAMLRHGEDTKP